MTDDVFQRLQAYVGREYLPGVYDCAHLAADVQADLFGRHVALPGTHPAGTAGQRRVIRAMRDELAAEIAVPFPGCAVLLTEPTPEGELLHIGTVALRHGEPWVLHNSAKLGSAHLHRLHDLQRWGMHFVGYYAWK
jgi:hypothetical protein